MESVPFLSARHVEAAVSPQRALEAVREAFVAYARGEWTMPPKVYVPAYPAGDFRAMPALGGGHALLKWVTSFPANPQRGLPTVMGLVLLSDASNGALRAGQHVSLMGADGPGKAEIAVAELARVRVFCDDWEQASHNGDLVHAVEAGVLTREGVTELGAVLAGAASGRRHDAEATAFDSTGLAIQDLAIALAALERLDELDDLPRLQP